MYPVSICLTDLFLGKSYLSNSLPEARMRLYCVIYLSISIILLLLRLFVLYVTLCRCYFSFASSNDHHY